MSQPPSLNGSDKELLAKNPNVAIKVIMQRAFIAGLREGFNTSADALISAVIGKRPTVLDNNEIEEIIDREENFAIREATTQLGAIYEGLAEKPSRPPSLHYMDAPQREYR
jgi:hypothetical protein